MISKIEITLAKKNGTGKRFYPRLVVQKIRTRYSIDEELAILRQRDTKPDEFAEYDAFVEAAKAEAKDELGLTSGEA